MKITIIGGCGYIGSKLFLYLKDRHVVNTIDTEWFGNTVNPNNLCIDYTLTDKCVHQDCDVIILLAGHSSVPMCINNRMESFKNNVQNFVQLLGRIEGTKTKLIYASSSSIYGDTKNRSVNEEWRPLGPKNYYDLQKQEIDFYASLSDVEFYGLRLGTVNGWSPNLRVDIMLNQMYRSAVAEEHICVFNKEIFRPILGIEDLCRAVDVIIDGGDHRGIYNLASFNTSVKQLSERLSATFRNVEIIDKGNTPSYNFSIDTSKFQDTYNFKFTESVESIVQSLKDGWDNSEQTVRVACSQK